MLEKLQRKEINIDSFYRPISFHFSVISLLFSILHIFPYKLYDHTSMHFIYPFS